MAEDENKEVFISYCTKNKELAQLFCNVVEGAGVSCWMAPRDIPSGGSWATSIAKGIEDALILALLVSDASMSSAEVEKEVDLANGRRMTILPIRIENAELKGAFKYHLSNKQWVDALEDDQTLRYNNTIEAILQNLGKESSDNDKAVTGYLSLARILANELNQKYAASLNQINSMFSARDYGTDSVEIFFPFRLGATGVDLKCQLDSGRQLMEISADLSVMDDLLKEPFISFAKQKKEEFFPRTDIPPRKRKEKIVIFEPPFPLAIGRVNLTEEKLFGLFRDNVFAFFDKITPDLLAWAQYGQYVADKINELTERLQQEFPESQGWHVGAPERERLDAFNSNPKWNWMHFGKLNIYKDTWVPDPPLSMGNPNGRGLLSFTLESGDSMLGQLSIGILKYEPWHDLDDELKEKLAQATAKVGLSDASDHRAVWRQTLEGDWRDSGIKTRDYRWQAKGSEFIAYCIERFSKLKELESDIDEICKAMPVLHTKSPDSAERQKWNDGLYVYNRLRSIAEEIAPKVEPHGISVSFKTEGLHIEWLSKEVFLRLKVGQFDAVAALTCTKTQMSVEFKNLEPPDFETKVIRSLIKERGIYDLDKENVKVQKDFDAGTEAAWFDRFAAFVTSEVDKILPELIALKNHLEAVVDIATEAGMVLAQALGGEAEIWKVENKAASLEKMAPISIWQPTWRKKRAKDDDLPPVMLQIISTEPCFDSLVISLRQNEQFDPKFEHRLGMVCGACEFAFGKSHDAENLYGIWSTDLPIFTNTGGSKFEINQVKRPLIADEEKAAFDECLQGIAKSIMKMTPLIASLCEEHNFKAHFVGELHALMDGLTKTLCDLFPEEEGWKMGSDISSLKHRSILRFYKQSWQGQKYDQKYGILNLTLQSGSDNFDDLLYGIMPTESITPDPSKDIRDKMTELFKDGRSSDGWPWWQFAEAPFRTTGGKEQKVIDEDAQTKLIDFFREKFKKMKEEIAPLIDLLLNKPSEINAISHPEDAACQPIK